MSTWRRTLRGIIFGARVATPQERGLIDEDEHLTEPPQLDPEDECQMRGKVYPTTCGRQARLLVTYPSPTHGGPLQTRVCFEHAEAMAYYALHMPITLEPMR